MKERARASTTNYSSKKKKGSKLNRQHDTTWYKGSHNKINNNIFNYYYIREKIGDEICDDGRERERERERRKSG